MRARPLSLALVALGTAAVTVATALPAAAATAIGPSTVISPYVLPTAPGVDITSLLTVNDSKAAGNGYEMVGIPDGLGAYRDGANTVVLMNHELRDTQGVTRAHGEKGAFVSKLTVAPDGRVLAGEDFINDVSYYQYDAANPDAGYASTPKAPAGAAGGHTAAFARFCSGFLSEPGQLLNPATGKGYAGQIYFANEESGNEGRVFGVTPDGQAHQLPRLGLFSWENTIVAPTTTDATVVMGNEDATPGELWIYSGQKTASGSDITKAGLTNGRDFVLTVPGLTNEAGTNTDAGFRAAYNKNQPARFSVTDVEWNQSGAAQNAEAKVENGLGFTRVEDGAFNPADPNEYWFLTTEGGDTTAAPTGTRDGGGLWRLRFEDVNRPELGGTLTLVLDGTETWGKGTARTNKPDNMMIDRDGNLLIQEDPGNNAHLARILAYRLNGGSRGVVATFDPARFSGAADSDFLTLDEESSGIIQLADGSYLFDAQVHTPKNLGANTTEYVENGQLLAMSVAEFKAVYGPRG